MAAAGLAPRFGDILRARPGAAARWLEPGSLRSWLEPLALILVCGALHGAAMGLWRAPLLALYVALKLPLLFLLTAMGNALAYGLWARRLGLELPFGASLRAVLLGF